MDWYSGNIAEAVARSKTKNAIFVVYIEGKDEMSTKLTNFIDDERIRNKLESDDFVAIKIEGDSETYTQFRSIYRVVPVPSIFFIGKSGTPLEIGTGIIATVEELLNKIDAVLITAGKKSSPSNSSTSFIAAEQQSSVSQASVSDISPNNDKNQPCESDSSAENKSTTNTNLGNDVTPIPDSFPHENSSVSARNVAGADKISSENSDDKDNADQPQSSGQSTSNDANRPQNTILPTLPRVFGSTPTNFAQVESNPANINTQQAAAADNVSASLPNPQLLSESQERIAQLQRTLEERRRIRVEEESRMEKDVELRRRKEGNDNQSSQSWQQEQELRSLQENIRRERQADLEARERIRAQIAADRAERAAQAKREMEVNAAKTPTQAQAPVVTPQTSSIAPNETRLQFRLPTGVQKTKTFDCEEPLLTVREYVRTELLSGTNIREFKLVSNYPRREFKAEDEIKSLTDLNLVPNAIVLVLSVDQGLVRSSGGLFTVLATIFWAMLTPAAKAFDYVQKMGFKRMGQRISERWSQIGWNRPNTGEFVVIQADAAQRRNMDIFVAPNKESNLQTTPVLHDPTSTAQKSVHNGTQVPTQGSIQGQEQGPKQGPIQGTTDSSAATGFQNSSKRTYTGEANIHRLSDSPKEPKDDNATYNGNSTQQQ